MKIAVLAIAALVGFWVVGAVVEHFQKRTPKAASSAGAHEGPRPATEQEAQPDPIEDACRVLKLTRPFTSDQLRAAYRQRMSQYHPDKVSSLAPEFRELAESKSKEINRAFDLLARFSR
ncbi:hypothetical protein BZM27_34270 [Paraburkholderia steynii]|uniref:J domain-containing protein n=1 Tax=Paraburkholderia steynii TaxID=1245441 RepID=A0A4R0XEL6_9BURK|nr:hypothetical protein BZM27_34270 [Paraburkholderia steynii]